MDVEIYIYGRLKNAYSVILGQIRLVEYFRLCAVMRYYTGSVYAMFKMGCAIKSVNGHTEDFVALAVGARPGRPDHIFKAFVDVFVKRGYINLRKVLSLFSSTKSKNYKNSTESRF